MPDATETPAETFIRRMKETFTDEAAKVERLAMKLLLGENPWFVVELRAVGDRMVAVTYLTPEVQPGTSGIQRVTGKMVRSTYVSNLDDLKIVLVQERTKSAAPVFA